MLTLTNNQLPPRLASVTPYPERLFVSGDLEKLLHKPSVAIVGSRKVSAYGRQITEKLARQLAEQGVVVVSGLALGVDSIAHRAVLAAGGQTIAVLPGPIETIYPATHRQLATQIIDQGGALVSEYPTGTPIMKHNFIGRNRLIAGLADAVLITEAALKSGSLHTARFALEQGRSVLAVPGNITSPTSQGTNNLIKAGAIPVTQVEDILHVLGVEMDSYKPDVIGNTEAEQAIINLLARGLRDGTQLQEQSGLDVTHFNQSLTMLEITGKIRSLGNNNWTLA